MRSLRSTFLGVVLAGAAAHAADRLHAGNWEYSLVTEGETRKLTSCVTADQAAEFNADSKTGRAAAEKKAGTRCTVKSYEANGETVSYTLVCGDRTITDVTHYRGETSEGEKTTTAAGKVTVTRVTAKRLGPCP